MFETIFTFSSHSHTSAPTRLVLTHVDDTIHQASAQSLEEDAPALVTVYMDPRDCHDSLVQIVALSDDVVRIECSMEVCTKRVVALHVCVCTSTFLSRVTNGGFPSEEALILLARATWRDAHLPTPHLQSHRPDVVTSSTHVPSLWRDWILFPHQQRSLAWMQHMESQLPMRINYSGNIRIAEGWYLDTETECLTRSPSTREAHLRGGVCANEPGSGKTAIILRLLSDTSSEGTDPVTDPVVDTFVYSTKATLIILPLNLISQWSSEIKKFLHDDVRVLKIVRAQDLRYVTMTSLCNNYDIVLTTFYFLKNCRGYTDLVDAALGGRPRARASISSWARQRNHEEPLLEAVRWRRIVVDEIHGTFESARDLRMLHLFNARALWGLTGTLTLDSEALYTFLEREKSHHPNLMQSIVTNAVRCDDDSQLEIHYKPLRRVERVDVSREERIHMEHVDNAEDEIRLTSFVDGTINDDVVEPEEQFRRARQIERERLTLRIMEYRRTMDVLNNTLSDLENESCRGDTRDTTLRELTRLDNLRITDENELQTLDNRAEDLKRRLREMETNDTTHIYGLGTKMQRVGELLCSLQMESSILFVQWKSMVRGVRVYLRSIGVRVFHLEGNTSHREATLAEFRRGGVLVLCMEESFAGLHLAHVKTIVFAHAIVGDVGTVHRLERQAIARCIRHGQTSDVDVYSFVVSESDEEVLWRETHAV